MKTTPKKIIIGTGYMRAFFLADSNFKEVKKDENGIVSSGVYKGIPVEVNNDKIADSVDEKELLSAEELKQMGIDLIILNNPKIRVLSYKKKNILYMIIDDKAFDDFLSNIVNES